MFTLPTSLAASPPALVLELPQRVKLVVLSFGDPRRIDLTEGNRISNMRIFTVVTLFVAIAQSAATHSCADYSPAPVPVSQLPAYFLRQKSINTASLADIEEIRQTLSEYAFIIDGRTFDALSDVFAANATANYSEPLGVLAGVETIKTTLSAALAQFPGTQHLLGSQRIRLCSKSTAISATYFRAAHFLNATVGATETVDDSAVFSAYAQYQDSWVKRDGLWKIAYRNVVYMVSHSAL